MSTPDLTPERLPSGVPPRAVTWRSILLGLAGVIFICILTPYNDYVVNNTFLVGNFLPLGLLLFFILFILLVNAPLSRFRPRSALRTGELAVSLGMALLSCTLPSSGMMRYLPAHLVSYNYHAYRTPEAAEYQRALNEANLPDWLFPSFTGTTVDSRARDPIVENYISRAPVIADNFTSHWQAVPWHAWARPALAWGALLAAVYGAVVCGSVIVRYQWVENERLQFPLADVYLALIQAPQPRQWLNPLLQSRRFWVGFALVFGLHAWNGLARYASGYVPWVPLGYSLHSVFSFEPFVHLDWNVKQASLYFSIIGIAFFLQTKVAFGLWFIIIAMQVVRMWMGTYQTAITTGMETDQTFGGVIVYVLFALYVGRAHWLLVLRSMLGLVRPSDPDGRYLPYAAAGWGLVVCCAGVVAWLMAAGASLAGGIVAVLMLLMLFFAVARVVAETGLIFVQLTAVPIWRPWILALHILPSPLRTTSRTFFLTTMLQAFFAHDMREASSVYATEGMRITDTAAYDSDRSWKRSLPYVALLVLALAVGYLASGASMLYCEYTHAATLDRSGTSPINSYGLDSAKWQVLGPSASYRYTGPWETHNRLAHLGLGAGITAALSALRLRFTWWPIHPVAFLLLYSYPLRVIWFSVFVGWLAKLLAVKFGGVRLLRNMRSVFIGLILGEVGAAAVWLIVSLLLNALGQPYYKIGLLPG